MLENYKINIPRASVFFSFCLNKSTKFNKGEEKNANLTFQMLNLKPCLTQSMMRYCYYLLKYSLAHIKRNCYMDEESVVDVTHGKNWVQI